MTASRRDERTAQVVAHSLDLQRQLRELAVELDRYVHALQAEVDRLHQIATDREPT